MRADRSCVCSMCLGPTNRSRPTFVRSLCLLVLLSTRCLDLTRIAVVVKAFVGGRAVVRGVMTVVGAAGKIADHQAVEPVVVVTAQYQWLVHRRKNVRGEVEALVPGGPFPLTSEGMKVAVIGGTYVLEIGRASIAT